MEMGDLGFHRMLGAGELRPIQNSKSLFKQKSFQTGQCQTRVNRNIHREGVAAKKGNDLMGYKA